MSATDATTHDHGLPVEPHDGLHDERHDEHDEHDVHDHDRGLSHDLPRLLDRRRVLGLLGGLGLATSVAACSDDGTTSTAATPGPSSSSGSGSTGAPPGDPPGGDSSVDVSEGEIPEETAGPFPGDGSNGPDVLAESGVVRSDITSSFGSSTTVAEGVPLTVRLRVLDVSDGASAGGLAGAAVYLWHCDREGRYSLYSDGVTDENYLRGVQEADADGWVTFRSIYPAAYAGRWPHIHFEVYPSLDDATSASNKLRTTQLALPEDVSRSVYATDGYDASVANLAQTSLQTDMVFSDGYSLQMATVTGSVGSGLTATLNVPV